MSLKDKIIFWVEGYLYNPTPFQKLLSYILLPLSGLYCFVVYLRFKLSKEEDFGIKIIGIGNLNVGGSGKTPFVVTLASQVDGAAVILRGYGRASQGLYVVKDTQKIVCDVACSGDEAMIYAQKLPNAIVIVSEDRKKAIVKAKQMGAKVIFLDDAYSKHTIQKKDVVIKVESQNHFCLPSGAFRELLWKGKDALIVQEGKDFWRETKLVNPKEKLSLVTAIARPQRLDPYLPEVVSKNYFGDHHSFKKEELEEILQRDGSDALLVTYKDYVKVEDFGVPLTLLDLEIVIDQKILNALL